MRNHIALTVAAIALGLGMHTDQFTQACHLVKMVAGDGTTVVGRDMQFGLPEQKFPSHFHTHPKGRIFQTLPFSEANPLKWARWEIKYGYIAVDLFDGDAAADGLNTEGLQCAMLYMPGWAEYQTPPVGAENFTIPQYSVCDWVLGLHSTVKEVNASLPDVYVLGSTIPSLGIVPVHYSVTDRSGESIVVEYTKNGTLNIFDMTVGVMTNSPSYDWHLSNLGMYAPTMLPLNPDPITYGNIEYGPQGLWGSMVGLPGNHMSASRFIRLAVFLHHASTPERIPTADKAINLAGHLLNTGDIINGTIGNSVTKSKNGEDVVTFQEDTSLYSVIMDLKSMGIYFRSYDNLVWQYINVTKLDLTAGAEPLFLPVFHQVLAPEATSQFAPRKLG